MPKLSIITINLNNKAGLQRTIDSVISQTYKDIEWIVIDGGSTDGSKELIEKYSSHIAYWVSEPDKGIYNAMNKGIQMATGEYLQFLNSGDCLYDEDVIADFVKRVNKEDVIYGNVLFVDAAGKELRRWQAPDLIKFSDFINHYAINHQATFFSNHCFEELRYCEDNKIVSDWELIAKLLYESFVFVKFDRYVVRFDITGVSSNNHEDETDRLWNILPTGIQADYRDFIQFRDVDLAIIIKEIIHSNRFFREITRLLLYPIYFVCKKGNHANFTQLKDWRR